MTIVAPYRSLSPVSRPLQPRRLLIIHNPTAGARRARRLSAVVELLRQRFGTSVEVMPTGGRGDAESMARAADPARFDAVVAAGGDGTINEVINGLVDAGGRLPLGLIPLGTANVLAGELGLDGPVEATAETLAEGGARAIHLGAVNGRRFAMMAGAGFDAQVVERIDPALKRLTGKGAYAIESLAQLVRSAGDGYGVEVGERCWNAASVIVAKGRYYGGRFICAPQANLFEPSLQVCLFPRLGRWNAVRYIWGVVAGRLRHFGDVEIVPARRLTITGPEGAAVQADGDVIARLPAEITLDDQRLPVLTGSARR